MKYELLIKKFHFGVVSRYKAQSNKYTILFIYALHNFWSKQNNKIKKQKKNKEEKAEATTKNVLPPTTHVFPFVNNIYTKAL